MTSILIATLLLAQKPSAKQIAEAHADLRQAVKRSNHAKPAAMFMLAGPKDKWIKMKTDHDHLDKDGMWREDISEVADVYMRHGHVYLVSITESSPSGDWSTFASCLYRDNGNLQICHQRYAAFSPNEGAVESETILDEIGKSISQTQKATDLKGKKKYSGAKAKDLFNDAKRTAIEINQVKTVNSLGLLFMLTKKK